MASVSLHQRLASLASNKSQQDISSQPRHPGHTEHIRDTGRQLGWSRAKLLSVLISYCRITDYARLGESSLPRVTWRPARTCTKQSKHTGRLPKLSGEYVSKTIQFLPSFSLFSVLQNGKNIFQSHKRPDGSLL